MVAEDRRTVEGGKGRSKRRRTNYRNRKKGEKCSKERQKKKEGGGEAGERSCSKDKGGSILL